jgi:hypothetical protein
MNPPPQPSMPPSVDGVFLALGQTLYACQLFEATMLEILASAHEVLKGTGDGTQFQASIETLSRQTLGQLLQALRKVADIRPDIDAQLGSALEARNFVVHRFAAQVGDDLTLDRNIPDHQRALYERCSLILEANSTAVSVLQALARLQSDRSSNVVAKLEQAANALRSLANSDPGARH